MDFGNFLRLAFAGLLIDLQVLQLQSKALSLRKAQVGRSGLVACYSNPKSICF